LAELPFVPGVSSGSDQGIPYALMEDKSGMDDSVTGKQWDEAMARVAENVRKSLL
jgi:hypothetical protein